MEQVTKALTLFALTFLVMILVMNLNRRIPRLPFDPYIDKFGFGLYIPLFSSLVVSTLLTIALNILQ